MSVEGNLGISGGMGGGAALASELAGTGNPIAVGLIVGAVVIIVLGLATRFVKQQ